MSGLDYGRGPFAEGEATIRAHILACARAACLPPKDELAQLSVLVGGMPRWDLVQQSLARRVAYLEGSLHNVPFDGYEWTLERIEAYVLGISEGKAATVMGPTDTLGKDRYYAVWPDTDWRAWERHPKVPTLWREVPSDQEQAAPPAPSMKLLPPDVGAADVGLEVATEGDPKTGGARPPVETPATSVASSPAPTAASSHAASSSGSSPSTGSPKAVDAPSSSAPKSAAPVGGDRPSLDELYAAPPVRAQASGTCCLCLKPFGFEELVRALRGHSAHFHCATPKPAAGVKTAHVGERIRELRKAAGLTQAELAKQIGVKASLLSEVERGKGELTPDQLGNLGSHLGVTQLDLNDVTRPLPKVTAHPAAGRGDVEEKPLAPPPEEPKPAAPPEEPKPAAALEPDELAEVEPRSSDLSWADTFESDGGCW